MSNDATIRQSTRWTMRSYKTDGTTHTVVYSSRQDAKSVLASLAGDLAMAGVDFTVTFHADTMTLRVADGRRWHGVKGGNND